MAHTPPLIFRADLPTPDLVLVRGEHGDMVLFADARIPQSVVDAAVDDLDTILAGPARAIG